MSHSVIIIHGPTKPGFAATTDNVSVEVEWTPPHDMTPAQERKITEKIEKIVAKIVAVAGGAEHEE